MRLDPQDVATNDMYRFLIGAVVPRPIAWVSSRGADGGVNLAPFSYFIAISSKPALIGVAINEREGDPKDTMRNIRETGEWVVNVVSEPLLSAMVQTSGEWPRSTNEFGVAGLTAAPSIKIAAPRVLESPIHLECKLYRDIPLGNSVLMVGEVVYADADDSVLTDGRIDAAKLKPVGRLGGEFYQPLHEVRKVVRPRVSRATGEPIG
jgi:flavin reductase (DIM6/NTAB) family NADH-FMN oxidoreductase RutF